MTRKTPAEAGSYKISSAGESVPGAGREGRRGWGRPRQQCVLLSRCQSPATHSSASPKKPANWFHPTVLPGNPFSARTGLLAMSLQKRGVFARDMADVTATRFRTRPTSVGKKIMEGNVI